MMRESGDSPDPREFEEDEMEEDDDDTFSFMDSQMQTNKGAGDKPGIPSIMMNGADGIDKGKKQKMWRRDMLRTDDTSRMKDIVGRLKK